MQQQAPPKSPTLHKFAEDNRGLITTLALVIAASNFVANQRDLPIAGLVIALLSFAAVAVIAELGWLGGVALVHSLALVGEEGGNSFEMILLLMFVAGLEVGALLVLLAEFVAHPDLAGVILRGYLAPFIADVVIFSLLAYRRHRPNARVWTVCLAIFGCVLIVIMTVACILEVWLTTPRARQILAPLVSQGRKKASVAAPSFLPEPEPLPGPLVEPGAHKDGRAGSAVRKEAPAARRDLRRY